MKAKPDCIVCLFKQGLNTARAVTSDPKVHLKVLSRVAALAQKVSLDQTPAALSKPVYDIVSEITGVRDPFRKVKRETNRAALRLLPDLEEMVHRSRDPLKAAIHLAAAGNIIDFGIGHAFDLEKDVAAVMKQKFAVDDYPRFRRDLQPRRKLLYLGDNAGEIVFDRVLVEHLLERGVDVTFTVKSAPIINDATMEDARTTGMTSLTRVIETGSNDIGVKWDNVSGEFRQAFESADIILGKGHGNFETCWGRTENIYFLLKAKCEMVAEELGVRLGDTVFRHARR